MSNHLTESNKKKLLGLLASRPAAGEDSLKKWGREQRPQLLSHQAEEIADALVEDGLATVEVRTSGRVWRAVTRKPEPPPIEVTTGETPGETARTEPTPTENDVELVELSEEAEVLVRPAPPKGVTPGLAPDGLPHPEAPAPVAQAPAADRNASVTPEPTPAPAPITPASRPPACLDDLTEEQLVALLAARRAEARARDELAAFERRVAGERVAIEARVAAARAAWEVAARGEQAPAVVPLPRPTPAPAPAALPEGATLRERVLDLFQVGHELRGAYVASELGVTVGQSSPVISRLVQEGALERIDRGVYRLARGRRAA